MFGENEVRRKAAPISSAMEWKALLKIASSMGAACADINHHVQQAGYLHPGPGRNERGRAVFCHDGGPGENITGPEPFAVVNQTRQPVSVGVYLLLGNYSLPAVVFFSFMLPKGGYFARENRSQANRNGFYPSLAVRVTVAALVLPVETLGRIAVPVDRDFVSLSAIAKIDGTEMFSRVALAILGSAQLL